MQGRVDIESEEYPELLRKIPNPPRALYYKGVWGKDLFDYCFGMVGSRRMSAYGKKVVSHLLSPLHKSVTIVSGFMCGVDAESHRVAIEKGLRTIAVMPCGINYIHPEDQTDLYHQIAESSGCILSEFDGAFKPKLWTYPKRNRIIAGLSKGLIVVEATLNSGSLISAKYAKEYGREVFAVPGSIFNNLSKGSHQLINTYAKAIVSGLEINEFFGFDSPIFQEHMKETVRHRENNLLKIIKEDPQTVDSLAEELGKTIAEVNSEITLLLLSNKITEEGGKLYAC